MTVKPVQISDADIGKTLHVYLFLRERILLGQYAPGQKVLPATLVTAFDWSSTPIRDAIATLMNEGYIWQIKWSVYGVKHWSPEAYADAHKLRSAIMQVAIIRAAERLNDDDKNVLNALIEFSPDWQRLSPQDAEEYMIRTRLFFEGIQSACQIPYLRETVSQLYPIALQRLVARTFDAQRAKAQFQTLREILDHLTQNNNPIGAMDLLNQLYNHEFDIAAPAIQRLSRMKSEAEISIDGSSLDVPAFVDTGYSALPFQKGEPEPISPLEWIANHSRVISKPSQVTRTA